MPQTNQKYVIDTCSLVAMRRVYPQDIFPGAWDKLDELAEAGKLISTELVLTELSSQDDKVVGWAKKHSGIFFPLDEPIQLVTKEILASHANLIDLKRRKSNADPFVVATAIVKSCAVVTEEKPSGGPQKSKIPDVCTAYSIEYMPILEMFRIEGLQLK